MVFCPRKFDNHVRGKVQSVSQVHSSFSYRRTLRDLIHNDTKVHRSYSSVSVDFKHTILFSLSIHLILNYIISMPQYIPRRLRGREKEGGNKPRGVSRRYPDTRGVYKSRVIDGKCYIINATHIQVYIYIYYILQAEIEADTHVSIILLICSIVESFYILHDVILEKSTSQAKVF